MASRKEEKEALRRERLAREKAEAERAARARKLRWRAGIVVVAAVVGLGVLFAINSTGGGSSSGDKQSKAGGTAGQFKFAVGDPKPGQQAPPIRLPSTDGKDFDLADYRGKRVLLYFQEGLMCQPCWDQINDLERQMGKLRALGIDQMVSITTDPLDQLRQKKSDEGFSSPVLSDRDLAVSKTYSTNQYGMMGEGYNGHSFIVVGPDGRIEHRADYGGPPDHTMYVPPDNLLADLRRGLGAPPS